MSIFWPRCALKLTFILDGRGGANSKPKTIVSVPRSCTVSRNGYHEADTFNAELDLRVLPFDPEIIASCAVDVYMWDSQGDESANFMTERNRMIQGLIDEPELAVGGHRAITISGRDYTAILDPDWDPRDKVPSGIPLTEAVQFVADKAAPAGTTARFLVQWESDDPIPLSGGTSRSTKRKGMWVKEGKTHWDVIYDLCIQHGYIVFIVDTRIIISDPRSQTKKSLAAAPRITHGRDLISFNAKRKLARERVPQIRVIYWNAAARDRFDVTYPTETDKHPLAIGAGLKKNEVLVLPAPTYCHDRDSALRFAKMRWEMMARAESTYTLRTRHMTIPAAGDISELFDLDTTHAINEDGDFDLLQMQAGDAIGVRFDPFNLEDMRALSEGERVAFLEDLGYRGDVAAFVAANFERLNQFRQPYYARKLDYQWSQTDGLQIEIEAVNFADERKELKWAEPGAVLP